MSQKSKVYFTDLRVPIGTSLLTKMKQLLLKAEMDKIDFDNKFTAIKIHFGEPGNLTFLRPNYAKVVADLVKELGGTPFLTDCNTLYIGRRKHALEHLESAAENGFSTASTGCQLIIADGLKGNSDVEVPVPGATLIETAKIGKEVMEADVFISLNHFKGHECTGFGGALKNVGMGCASRRGKMEQHNGGKPAVKAKYCVNCKGCASSCGQDAIDFSSGKAVIDQEKCVGCGRCLSACNFNAIFNPNSNTLADLSTKMAEYAKAVLDGRPHFHINLVIEISPFCDCHPESDMAILPNIGMFASYDPVALDKACVDACLKTEPIPGSMLYDNMKAGGFQDHHDHFTNTHPDTQWKTTLEHAEKMGIGTCDYELITM